MVSINTIAAHILNAVSILLRVVLPFFEFGEIIIAFSNTYPIFYATTDVPDNFKYSFLEVLAKNPTIFLSSSQLLEPKLQSATIENPNYTIDLSPPIILKYS